MPPPIPHSLVRRLREVPIFTELENDMLLAIVGDSANLRWPADRVVFATGDEPEALYVVLRGEVAIVAGDGPSGSEVTRFRRGDYFGEQSLLAGDAHSMTARTIEDTELMVIPRETFEALLEADAELQREIHERLERRRAEGGPPGPGPPG